MRENRPSGSEGGVALRRHPYPYRTAAVPGRLACYPGFVAGLAAAPWIVLPRRPG